MTKREKQIVDAIREGRVRPVTIARALGISEMNASVRLSAMVRSGAVRRVDYGVYALPTEPAEQ